MNGRQEGNGKLTRANGQIIDGEWKDSRPHGHVKDETPDGQVYIG